MSVRNKMSPDKRSDFKLFIKSKQIVMANTIKPKDLQ